jgi:hypothetical protein
LIIRVLFDLTTCVGLLNSYNSPEDLIIPFLKYLGIYPAIILTSTSMEITLITSEPFVIFWLLRTSKTFQYMRLKLHTYHSHFIPEGVAEASHTFLQDAYVLPNLSKPIAVWSQSILGVNAINPSFAFYDIHGRKKEVLFFYFVSDTTRDILDIDVRKACLISY